jgi:hypothetical protein
VRIALALLFLSASATAEPADLRIRPGATPKTLRMRTAAADDTPAPDPDPDPDPDRDPDPAASAPTPASASSEPASLAAAISATASSAAPRAKDFELSGVRRADEQVVFRLDVGFGVDGAAITGRRALGGEPLSSDYYREARAQAFGNLFVGTRGLAIQPLSSYLSLGFRFTPRIQEIAPLADALDSTRDVQIRAGWAEAANFLPGKYLGAARVRAGRQYAYGPWPIHFDGTMLAWTSKALQLSVLGGVRVDDFAPTGSSGDTPALVAVIGAVNLGELGRWPVTVRGTMMWLGDRRFGDLELGYRPRRGLVVVAGARAIDSKLARERATIRAQISDVTHVVLDFEHRHATDWRWDMSYIEPTEPGAARPYLELPLTTPQLKGAIRGGTVLLDNIDLFLRAAAAVELGEHPDERPGYAEIGGAFEVRVRRSFALFGSALARDYELTDTTVIGTQQLDEGNVAQPLVDPLDPAMYSSIGEESFGELGGGARVTTGARRFSGSVEGYLRRSKYSQLYTEDSQTVGDILDRYDLRTGVRFAIDGWMSKRLRLHLEYDFTSTLDHAPEINGWKILRVLAEGSF